MRLCKFLFLFFVTIIALPAVTYAADLKIGVVNLNLVFENYTKRAELEESFREIRDREEETLREKQDSLMDLREEIQLMERGSEARREKEAELEKKILHLQVEEEVARKNLAAKEKEYYEELYSDIKNAITEIGKNEGFDLILKKEEVEPKSADLLELRLKIGMGAVLFYSDAVDITNMVVEYLNKNYAG